MIDHDAITTAASNDVIAAGIKYDSPDYPHAVKKEISAGCCLLHKCSRQPWPSWRGWKLSAEQSTASAIES